MAIHIYLVVVWGLIITCTAMDELASSARDPRWHGYNRYICNTITYKGHSILDAGTPTGQTPVKEIDFLSKVGSGRDDLLLSPGSSTVTPTALSPAGSWGKTHLRSADGLARPHSMSTGIPSHQSNLEEQLHRSSDLHDQPLDSPKALDLLNACGKCSTSDHTSPNTENILVPVMFAYRPSNIDGKPVQSGEARNLLSTSHSLGTRRVIGETSASQVGLPLPKKMRIDMPPSTRQFLSQPVTDCNNPPTRQGTMTAIGTIPKTVDYTVLRLEFSYGVLVTQNSEDRNSLVEDQVIIDKIKDFSQMEDFIIKKSRFNDAFTMFAECLGTFKEQSALDLKYKYPGRSPREVYLFTCFNECWKNSAGWFTYWRITQDIMSSINPRKSVQVERLLLLYLSYVNMIDKTIPRPADEGLDALEHDSKLFETAIDIFRRITNPAHGDTELTIIEDDFKPRSRQAPLRDMSASYKTLLWRWLKVWILNSGRDYLRINFFYNHYSNQAFLSFFNKLFCLSIKGNNRRLLESSAAIIHVSS
ncbi:hypothetical protein Pst134EA_000882 [Puccinia striiformis f. sp. tritici]|uniref:hypothetical protein n=1 Tax=Puccinia striiformis f. sp. tritici TaxID=168172 RepID=UPI00200776DF|nr:hypothetical protein Pst134EA_000882 [Puccinia striiformis f. sp. tritici]KAH9473818.1 hypothetical protein Pst134EA_000882 [Puccinia striiformis f. sp. tritici]